MQQLARQFISNSTEGGNATYRANFGETIDYKEDIEDEPHHFHVMCHRHNTHVTVTKPNRDAIISISAGNLGFKKSGRGTFDAGYQVTAYVIDKLHQMGEVKNIKKLEVAFRGFGQGRDAAVKVLLGSEGKALKDKIIRVTDATRIKFGGTRGRNPRRL
jgi:small subunit ribosomal protein S11